MAELTFIPAQNKSVGILSKQRDGVLFLGLFLLLSIQKKKRCFFLMSSDHNSKSKSEG